MSDLPFALRDPAQLLRQVAQDHRFVVGDLLIALVDAPSTDQRLVAVRRIKRREWQDLPQHELSGLLRELARGMPIPSRDEAPYTHELHTILCRPGLTVVDGEDAQVLAGWRYSNHLANAGHGGMTVVTEHGWYDLLSDTAGHEPALDLHPKPTLRAC